MAGTIPDHDRRKEVPHVSLTPADFAEFVPLMDLKFDRFYEHT